MVSYVEGVRWWGLENQSERWGAGGNRGDG